MKNQQVIGLKEFRKVVEELANETKSEFPNLYFGYAGIIPVEDAPFRYDSSPINTEVFATTGGDGTHYSILELSPKIQLIIMTVPMNFGDSMNDYNCIIGENLNEFLSLGYYHGWSLIEQLYYGNEWVINHYSSEDLEDDYQNSADGQFVMKLRTEFGYKHIPLKNKRLRVLKNKYFNQLRFNPTFLHKYIKSKK